MVLSALYTIPTPRRPLPVCAPARSHSCWQCRSCWWIPVDTPAGTSTPQETSSKQTPSLSSHTFLAAAGPLRAPVGTVGRPTPRPLRDHRAHTLHPTLLAPQFFFSPRKANQGGGRMNGTTHPFTLGLVGATRGCNTPAAAEYTYPQWGGVGRVGTLTAEWYSQEFNLGTAHNTSTWGIRDARAGKKAKKKRRRSNE